MTKKENIADKQKPSLKVSFSGGIRLRAAVTADRVVVGEMVRRAKAGWHEGPANSYRFEPNQVGVAMGLRAVSELPSVRATINKATGGNA